MANVHRLRTGAFVCSDFNDAWHDGRRIGRGILYLTEYGVQCAHLELSIIRRILRPEYKALLRFRKLFATGQTQQPATINSATTHTFAWHSQHKRSIQHVSTTYLLGYPGVAMEFWRTFFSRRRVDGGRLLYLARGKQFPKPQYIFRLQQTRFVPGNSKFRYVTHKWHRLCNINHPSDAYGL